MDDIFFTDIAQHRAAACGITGSVTNGKARSLERAEALWVTNYGWMVRLAWLLTGSQASGQDAVSEAWLRCWDKLDTVESPVPYLRTAIVNVCLNEKRHLRVVDRYLRSKRSDDTVEALGSEHLELIEALEKLPRRQRSVVVMRYLYDMTDQQIGEVLGMRAATVRSNLRHGLAALRKHMDYDQGSD